MKENMQLLFTGLLLLAVLLSGCASSETNNDEASTGPVSEPVDSVDITPSPSTGTITGALGWCIAGTTQVITTPDLGTATMTVQGSQIYSSKETCHVTLLAESINEDGSGTIDYYIAKDGSGFWIVASTPQGDFEVYQPGKIAYIPGVYTE